MTVGAETVAERLPALRARNRKLIHDAGAGHPGGSLSVIDALALIMLSQGRFAPDADEQDWIVLAKGHSVPALYAVLVELGYLEEAELASYRKLGSRLQGHPDRRKTPGVQVSSGHLGQGISVAVGIALGEQRHASGRHTWVIAGEGDLHEGQSWEALMAAAHHRVGGLT
ncbi:MAG: transketolase, partial [Propionibacteriaceae bacterium]|nr:transketolase [Propionibacteriaceae bacterium]